LLIDYRLILPCPGSDRIYIVDVKTDPRNPRLDKVRMELKEKYSGRNFALREDKI